MKYPILERSMCLVKRVRVKKQSESSTPRPRSKEQHNNNESSLELTNSTTNSSKESRLSSASATSLVNIRELLSDRPIIFQFKDLSRATDNFSPKKKLGSSVYWGKLQKTEIAIVAATTNNPNNNFVDEIKNLGSVHHSNLVRLLGGCMNGDHVYLVYDYIHGGTLHKFLHNSISPGASALPTWMSRIQVALNVAKGLEYLHHHTLHPSVHKYMKSSNILIDEHSLHVRIAYFGVAKLRGESETPPKLKKALQEGEIREQRTLRRAPSTKITGVHGYMAPEYVANGVISSKLDVFAFGVILLEILSGKEPVSFQSNGNFQMKKTLLSDVIVSIFNERDSKQRLRAWIDPVLRDRFPLDCAVKAAQLARNCVDPVPELRPDMSVVSLTLQQIQMTSVLWDTKMKASKDLLTSTMQAR